MTTHLHHKNPKSSNRKAQAPGAFRDKSSFHAAYERRLADIQAVPESALLPVNIDIAGAVTTILGVLAAVNALRSKLAKLPDFDLEDVDALPDYAMAAWEADSLYFITIAPPAELVALNEQAVALRDTLRTDAMTLAKHGLVNPARFASFTGRVGYRNVAFELMAWANLLGEYWQQIQSRTALVEADLQKAKELAEQLVAAVGQKEHSPEAVAATALIRQQAFTLMVNAYERVRHGVAFIEWQQGASDTITPSLYAGRGRHPKPAAPSPEPAPEPAPVPPVVNPVPSPSATREPAAH